MSTPPKHTPGPWFIADWHEDGGPNKFTIEARKPEVLLPGQSSIWPDGVACSRIATTEEGEGDRLANARLIAASPRMYDYIAKRAAEGDAEAAEIIASTRPPQKQDEVSP